MGRKSCSTKLDRRELLKRGGKVLPALAVLGLALAVPTPARADCTSMCEGECKGSCTDVCTAQCGGGVCANGCVNTCRGNLLRRLRKHLPG